jgi:hypothetical protein
VTDIESIIPVSADEADTAAFRSLDAALRFAFGNRYRGEPDSLAQHQKRTGRGGTPRFEDAEERAAWAGVIRRRIETLDELQAAILIIRFAPRAIPCACRRACCSGWSRNEEWHEAASIVTERAMEAVPGTLSPRQLRAGIVRRWAGAERVNLGMLADKCGVHRNTAGTHAKAIRKWLDALLRKASDAADLALR